MRFSAILVNHANLDESIKSFPSPNVRPFSTAVQAGCRASFRFSDITLGGIQIVRFSAILVNHANLDESIKGFPSPNVRPFSTAVHAGSRALFRFSDIT